jgi:hypothetical protein
MFIQIFSNQMNFVSISNYYFFFNIETFWVRFFLFFLSFFILTIFVCRSVLTFFHLNSYLKSRIFTLIEFILLITSNIPEKLNKMLDNFLKQLNEVHLII